MPNEELRLIKDSEHGDYYEIINKDEKEPTAQEKETNPAESKKEKVEAKNEIEKQPIKKEKELKEFTADNIPQETKRSIEFWSSDHYQAMTQIANGKNINELIRRDIETGVLKKIKISKDFYEDLKRYNEILNNLFDNFKPNTKPNINLYRGINLTPTKYNELFANLKKGEAFILSDKTNQSFTTSKLMAFYRFADNRAAPLENIRVIFQTKSVGEELNIKNFVISQQKAENEHLIKKGKIFKVKKIRKMIGKDGKKWVYIQTEQIKGN